MEVENPPSPSTKISATGPLPLPDNAGEDTMLANNGVHTNEQLPIDATQQGTENSLAMPTTDASHEATGANGKDTSPNNTSQNTQEEAPKEETNGNGAGMPQQEPQENTQTTVEQLIEVGSFGETTSGQEGSNRFLVSATTTGDERGSTAATGDDTTERDLSEDLGVTLKFDDDDEGDDTKISYLISETLKAPPAVSFQSADTNMREQEQRNKDQISPFNYGAERKSVSLESQLGIPGNGRINNTGPVDLDETILTTTTLEASSRIHSPPEPILGFLPTAAESMDSAKEIDKAEKAGWVNEGFQRWEKARRAWLGQDQTSPPEHQNQNQETQSPPRPTAVPLDVDEIIDVIFLSSSTSAKSDGGPPRFPQNVALPQMVDILQDLWEAEGLDA